MSSAVYRCIQELEHAVHAGLFGGTNAATTRKCSQVSVTSHRGRDCIYLIVTDMLDLGTLVIGYTRLISRFSKRASPVEHTVARDLLTHSLRDDAVQRAFLTSFPDFQRRAARVDGALGRQRSGLFTLCGVTAR